MKPQALPLMMTGNLRFHKTRIAPTPSGYLHLGNILSFATTVSLAKRTGAKILLRIDDMDQERVNKAYIQDIFDTLNFMQISWDEGPRNPDEFEKEYSQVHRLDIYRNALQLLREQEQVFACACTRSQLLQAACICRNKNLSLDADNVCWRVYTPEDMMIKVKTIDGLHVTPFPATMKDFIVRKKDRFPAYQLTSLMDDLYFGIDLIVRGEDLWASTLAQLYLASLLGKDEFQKITFYHHALLTDNDGGKLSKSAGSTSIQYLRREHKTAEYIYSLIKSHMPHLSTGE